MFYSQFILAKKGPLGTIWIAAHLERKLRKNQVTETNIGVSVDSILFPEVPIALRLSGHLLLGVVRIYSRKVNYLFHDCSEALVKIKQAFHSGAVDLPPEAATAPFHSITLPETFDLDELELLPDREAVFLANSSADHHVTTREQITLQEPIDDDLYLTNDFDERFPDVDGPRFEFDEDVFYLKRHEAENIVEASEMLEQDSVKELAKETDQMDVDEIEAREPLIDLNGAIADDTELVKDPINLDINVVPEEQPELDTISVLGQREVNDTLANEEQLLTPGQFPVEQLPATAEATAEVEQASSSFQVPEDRPDPAPVSEGSGFPTEKGVGEGAGPEINSNDAATVAEEPPEIEKLRSTQEAAEMEPNILGLDDTLDNEKNVSQENQEDVYQIKEVEETPILKQDISASLQKTSSPPVSPAELPNVPADDDLLSTILGRRSSALRVAPTPSDVPPSKRQKPGPKPQILKKRKTRVDESTVLHGDVMRQQLADTSDIRRVRKRVPCSEREMWEAEKEGYGQQVFDHPLLPGVCENLRELYYCVYGTGETSLPLVDSDSDCEPAKSVGRKRLERDEHQMDLQETNEALSFAEEPYGELDLYYTWREDYQKVEAEPPSTNEPTSTAEPTRTPTTEPTSTTDEATAPLEPAVSAEPKALAEPKASAEETASPLTERGDEGVFKEEKSAEEELEPLELPRQTVDNVPSAVDDVGATREMEVRDETPEGAEPELRPEVTERNSLEGPEQNAEAVIEETVAMDRHPADEGSERPLYETCEAAEDGDKTVAENVEVAHSEQPVLQAADEQPKERLEFLIDDKDAADDEEDCDGDNTGSEAHDNSGWSVRTRAVCQYLRLTFESMEASKKEGSRAPKLGLENLLQGKRRREAARMFFETLVLKTKDYVNVEQGAPFDKIYISARSKLMKADL